MAGSLVTSTFLGTDPILSARLDALRILADQSQDPIAILDAGFNLIYANNQGEKAFAECQAWISHQTCGSTNAQVSITPCSSCPGKQVFEKGQPWSNLLAKKSSGPEDEKWSILGHCPFHIEKAVPLMGSKGEVDWVVLIGIALHPQNKEPNESPTRSHKPTEVPPSQEAIAHSMIFSCQAMQQLVDMIHLVAPSEATVLIQGDSGTGKERVAQTIHRLSKRKDHPFVVVDCSAIPETLLESELFGHVRGAFTGATTNRKGLFAEAQGGTIFLDEIGDTSLGFQAKLLRVLQEGEIKPVGSSQTRAVNVRVISASQTPLEALVKAKTFRADLFYRLAVLPLCIPPLRERQDDIPLLAQHFSKQSCHKHGKAPLAFDSKALAYLKTLDWPGNVRELEHLVERIVVTTQKGTVSQKTVEQFFSASPYLNDDLRNVAKRAREQAEKSRILHALKEANGQKSKAATLLAISRANLYNKLKAYGIEG